MSVLCSMLSIASWPNTTAASALVASLPVRRSSTNVGIAPTLAIAERALSLALAK
ncbi:hypothetical protein PR003_g18772 [Phytophthora rubi]|uniref:RxLR effector protein n=1 Tax=Phytophthora rubi TaxID=129364 RepID=A0A6A3JZR3_9STRA|nr:hypothetical protein PR002_g18212 [Phytophthora rubi]KAE9316252.1 hypothetical protein PR003_g18772 [Phytophthora rubi]